MKNKIDCRVRAKLFMSTSSIVVDRNDLNFVWSRLWVSLCRNHTCAILCSVCMCIDGLCSTISFSVAGLMKYNIVLWPAC